MVLLREEVHIILQMDKNMLEIINKIKEMDMEYTFIPMEINTLENSKKGKKMEKEHYTIKMEIN